MVNTGMMAENTPSPQPPPTAQCVGREFVRQYYTLLAEAPGFVYRFYSDESVYSRGEVEVIGQRAIGRKIAESHYTDCRTRILSLESHETISKGVVVQVSYF